MQLSGLQPLFQLPSPTCGEPLIIAGPCSAETVEQTLETARSLSEAGIKVFRAGVWKPRTKPGSFEGRGKEALEWLRKVKEQTGMLTATEVAGSRHLREAVDAGIDGVWIGARTTTNPFAVQEIADALAQLPQNIRERLTVLVKNPVNPDIELWIGSLERIYASGVRRLGAVHRGFSSYGKHIYRNQPRWAIPIELNRRFPELPIIFDPSHIGGRRDLVEGLVNQAANICFSGFIIESHCNPDAALSDSAQQITPGRLFEIISSIDFRKESHISENLEDLRRKIDNLDERLLELLAERMEVSKEIGRYKHKHHIPVLQSDRYKNLMEKRAIDGEKLDLSPQFVRTILAEIHEESVRNQINLKTHR